MTDLEAAVEQAQAGSLDAFEALVRQCQDMATAYAYSLLSDAHLAEDAAQDAFVQAYRRLLDLREPKAFPAWLRRIVFTCCDRLTRRRRVATAPLESAGEVAAAAPGPAESAEGREIGARVMDAIKSLPDHQSTAAKLFYVDGHSQKEVAAFMEAPLTTVKARIHAARQQLRARMMYLNDED